jgi:hypothetical protein
MPDAEAADQQQQEELASESGSSDSAEQEDDDSDAHPTEPGLSASLPRRATRGKRFRELEGEEQEAHEDFWGQNAWEEEDNDSVKSDEFSASDFQDSSDSDIDNDENEDDAPDAMHEQDVGEGKPKKQKPAKRFGLPPGARKPPAASGGGRPKPKQPLAPRSMSVRHTTASLGAELEEKQRLEAIRQSLKKQQRGGAGKTLGQGGVKPRLLTQRQLLEEAAKTEVENKASLEVMMLLMAEKKRAREKVERQKKGARIVTRSFVPPGPVKEERTLVTFTAPELFPKPRTGPVPRPAASHRSNRDALHIQL